MSENVSHQLMLEMQSIRQDLKSLMVAVMGDPKFNIDGMQQHIDQIGVKVCQLEKDVRGLKTDRVKIVAWVSGLAAGFSIIGVKAADWLKS